MVSRAAALRIDYNGYNAWDQPGFRAAALAGSDLASRIEDAAALVVANGYRKLVVPAPTSGLQKISRKIVLPANIGIDIQGIVQYTGSANEVAVEIGSATVQNLGQSIRVWVTRSTDSDWSTFANCGLLIHNLYNSHLDIQAEYFTLGAELRATNFGWSHNDVFLNRFTNCRVGLEFYTSVANTSWINQNTFYSGRWQIESQKRSSLSNPAAGVKDPTGIWFAGNGTGINNNVFINPSFEISGVTNVGQGWTRWPQVKPWLIECGATVNTMIDARHENLYEDAGTTPVPFLWVNSANVSANHVTIGYGGSNSLWNDSDLIKYMRTDASDHIGNHVVLNYRQRVSWPPVTATWNSGNLGQLAKQGKSTGEISIQGVPICEGNFLEELYSYYTTHTIASDHVIFAASTVEGPMWILDTVQSKRFIVKANCVAGFANMRYVLKPYDSAGAAMDGSTGTPLIRFIGAAWSLTMSDGYATGGEHDNPIQFEVAPTVASVKIFVTQFSAAALKLKSVSIGALDCAMIHVRSGLPNYNPNFPYANVAPASGWKGNWKTGIVVLNSAASAAGDPWGWRCRGDGANFDALNP